MISIGDFNITLGVEFTYLPPHMVEEKPNTYLPRQLNDTLAESYACIFEREMEFRRISNEGIGVDIHCIEINSPVFVSTKEVLNYRTELNKIAKKYKMTNHNDVFISGGGHVNVGGLDTFTVAHLVRDFAHRPYITWAFNDPCDNIIYPGIFELYKGYGASRNNATWLKCDSRNLVVKHKNNVRHALQHRCNGLRYREIDCEHLLEFRFFESARSNKEQKDHIDFTLAYIKKIVENNERKDPEYWKANACQRVPDINTWTFADCKKDFLDMIEELGLSRARYEIYVTRNLKERFMHKCNDFNAKVWQ